MNNTQHTKTDVDYQIEGMDCANCALTLERSLARLQGVDQVQVNFSTARLQASGDFDPQALVSRVHALGYRVMDKEPAQSVADARETRSGMLNFLHFLRSGQQTTIALIAALLLLASLPFSFFPEMTWASSVQMILHLAVVLLAGRPIALRGVRALWAGRQVTIDLLMSIATVGAVLIGETGEAATVIFLFTIGEALESYTAERARHSLRGLLALQPERAAVLRPCIDCAEHIGREGYAGGPCPFCGMHPVNLPVDQVQVGDTVVIRAGERIPVDGLISNGTSTINQSAVTGESVPVLKTVGEDVFAGTLNGEGVLEVEVTRPAGDSTISRILRLVEEAQAKRAPVERLVDRFAAWYTPAVVLVAFLVAVVPPLFWGAPFLDLPDGTRGWLYRSLALLIVACPCALVISTPVTVVSTLTTLARRGILVKGGAFLDILARVRVFAFDKTGTLTVGQPLVRKAFTLDCLPGQERCEACDEMLALASAVESRSEHPLAQAIMVETQNRQLDHRYPAAREVVSLVGQGVQGLVNGTRLTVGSHAHGHESFVEHDRIHEEIELAETDGQTVMLVSQDETVLGFVGVADKMRPDTAAVLQGLKGIDPHYRIVMLTGDHHTVAEKVASEAGMVDEVRADLLPGDKLEVVRQLQSQHGLVAMIGDGVNDTPALAAASVGIAMSNGGNAQAMETADVVLMQENLSHLPDIIRTSRRAQQIIWQNIAFSLLVKAAFLILTLPGLATLWMAVFADMGASLLVTMNGMRMLKDQLRQN
jgi:Cd2+/Zn2+-exporting ATPase